MRPSKPISALLVAAAAASLSACGTKRASVVVETVTVTTPTTSTPTVTSGTVPHVPPQHTRTGPGPAFTQTTGGTPATPSGALTAAVASLTSRGYTPTSTSSYRADNTLRVIVGRNAAGERAFFYDGDRYIGNDASSASRSVSVASQSDTAVTLRYATTSGARSVRFQLDQGHLMALDPIPPASARG